MSRPGRAEPLIRPRGGWLAVAWAPYSRRSEMFARQLGGRHACVHYLAFQSPACAPVKYVLQAARTFQLLLRERPAAVHVQNPPFVCGLVVACYAVLSGAPYVTEHHSAAFSAVWRPAAPVQKLLARRAAVNVVTSEHWAELVRSWGGRALVMHDPFMKLPDGQPYPVAPGFNVACVGTFAPDEPLEALLAAAARVPEVRFHVTGDLRRAPGHLVAAAPPNVAFTGFLDLNGAYLGLLRAVDAVVVLTTRDHTLQLGGCEAIAVGKPLVTSDFNYLRRLFGPAALYVQPTPESIAEGVRAVVAHHDRLAAMVARVRRARQRDWRRRLARLEALVTAARCGSGARAPRQEGVAA